MMNHFYLYAIECQNDSSINPNALIAISAPTIASRVRAETPQIYRDEGQTATSPNVSLTNDLAKLKSLVQTVVNPESTTDVHKAVVELKQWLEHPEGGPHFDVVTLVKGFEDFKDFELILKKLQSDAKEQTIDQTVVEGLDFLAELLLPKAETQAVEEIIELGDEVFEDAIETDCWGKCNKHDNWFATIRILMGLKTKK